MNITFNPYKTTSFADGFATQSYGLVQGVAMDDPATRFALAAGYLADTETLPMWGGVAIAESVPLAAGNGVLGGKIIRATTTALITGLSVFNQAHAMVNSPQSPVPLAGNGMSVNLYRLGSGARIAVQCDDALVNLDDGSIAAQVSWDLVGQQLVAYTPLHADLAITSMTWAAGVVSVVVAVNTLVTGDTVHISGATPAAYNGSHEITVADTTHFSFPLTPDPGAETVPGQVDAGGGAFPCKILRVQAGNSKVVVYDAATGFATWNPSGACALIQI